MMSNYLKILVILVVSQFLSDGLLGQNSPRIRTTSNLKDADGRAVPDGTYTITFRMYNEDSGGTTLWTEVAPVEVKGGLYTHLLGSVGPLSNINFNRTLYLGTQIGEYELAPRIELTYAPYAVAAQNVVCSGALGDIKYSLLNPAQFALVNGDCWVPMNGASVTNSSLDVKFGIGMIPDGSGLFIRNQEFLNGANNDPDRTSSAAIGTEQSDEVLGHGHTINYGGSHGHQYSDTKQQLALAKSYGVGQNGSYAVASKDDEDTVRTTNSSTTGISLSNNLASETRPTNINLWTYIRVN